MSQFVVANNVNTQLATAALSTATTLVLASSANLPTLAGGQMMPLTLNDAATGGIYETVYATAISGATLTVLRGQEGTSALNWNVGDFALCGPTAGTVAMVNGNPSNVFFVAPATASQHAVQLGQVRKLLTANLNLFVSATGSDSNNGLTSGAPFLTLQHAWNVLQQNYDLAGQYTATIQLANGTYTTGLTANGPIVGATSRASVVFNGNATPTNVIVSVTSGNTCFVANNGAQFTVTGMQLTGGTSTNGLSADSASGIAFSNLNFGSMASGAHIIGGNISATGNYAISGGAGYHLVSQGAGSTGILSAGITVTLTGTPAFSAFFAYAATLGAITTQSVTFSGSATGTRYQAAANGVINTNGGGASYFPGSVAGSTASGGQYL